MKSVVKEAMWPIILVALICLAVLVLSLTAVVVTKTIELLVEYVGRSSMAGFVIVTLSVFTSIAGIIISSATVLGVISRIKAIRARSHREK